MRRQEELPWWSVKILPSTAGGVWVCFLVGELSSHLPYGQKKKRHKTSSVVTNTKGPKMVHTKKKKEKKKTWGDERLPWLFRATCLFL